MNLIKNIIKFNKKRIILLLSYILITLVVNHFLLDPRYFSYETQYERGIYILGIMMAVFMRWTFLIAFFFITEGLVSRYTNWKRKVIRFFYIALVLFFFNFFVHPFSFIFDYFMTWLIFSKGIKVESTSQSNQNSRQSIDWSKYSKKIHKT